VEKTRNAVFRFLLFCLSSGLFGSYDAACQYTEYAQTVIDTLCSEKFHGRGYDRWGDRHAAEYIRDELFKAGIDAPGNGYFQYFTIPVNTFPGKVKLKINDHTLIPGRDFLIDPASPRYKGLLDSSRFGIPKGKLTFGISSQVARMPYVNLKPDGYPGSADKVWIRIRNRYRSSHETQNVIGTVPGTEYPDSFLVFTAHYDHLGLMGRNTFFPGANDNASGVAMVLSLARYFKVHPLRCSVVFIFFSAEELGLLGSEHFAENSLIRLPAVKFLVNLDLVGTGSEGITVVNATEFPGQYGKLCRINDSSHFVNEVKSRSAACVSDHCPFFRRGIPCFFIYTNGGIAAYHDLDDRPETLPLTAFDGLTNLLIEFYSKF